MSSTRLLSLAAALLLLPSVPLRAHAQEQDRGEDDAGEEQDTDQLPSYSVQELDEAQGMQQPGDQGAGSIPTWNDAQNAANSGGQSYQAPPPPAPQATQPAPPADPSTATFDSFYSDLSGYGTWVQTPQYGYVWVPNRQHEVNDWRPYQYGQWAWTDYGWTWVSEEPFGWATYHYGRWAFAPRWGWYWVPGYTWGPAWVVWRTGGLAVGWAPLYPGYVAWGASYPFYENHWLFVEPAFFYGYPVYRHCYPYGRNSYYYRESSWAGPWHGGTARTVFVGPRRTFIASRSSQPVRTASLQFSSQRGLRSTYVEGEKPTLTVYRPSTRAATRAPVSGPRVGSGLARNTLQSARPEPSARPTWSSAERVSPRDVRPPEAAPPLRNPPVFRAPTPAGGSREAPAQGPGRVPPTMRQPPPVPSRVPARPAQRPRAPEGTVRPPPPVQPRASPPRGSAAPFDTRGYASAERFPAPSAPQFGAPRYSTPYAPRFSPPSAPRPSFPSAPRFSPPTPHFSAPSAPHFSAPSAPHFSAPSAPHFSAPSAPHFSAPSAPHFSAPSAPHFSAPSFSGFHGGGRHR